jgi:tetratricopeptide (TPR) repeat protein
LSTRLPGRLEPLEWLVDTYGRTSDSFRMPDALAQLGDALMAAGKLERAKETFQQLVDREPESDAAKRRLNDVLKKLGTVEEAPAPPADIVVATEDLQPELPKTPAPKVRPGLEEPAPVVAAETPEAAASAEPELDEETQRFIAQSLTDVDLFASYGLTQKAIGLLEAILRRAPTHTPTLEKLLDFVLGAGDDRRTAELAAQLEHIHASRGDARSGERFGELRRRFQRAAGLTDEEIAAAVTAAMPQPVETIPVEESSMLEAAVEAAEVHAAPAEAVSPIEEAPAAEVPEIELVEPAEGETKAAAQPEEVDLSAEWASLLEEASLEHAAPAPQARPPASPQAIEFEVPEFSIEEEKVESVPVEAAEGRSPVAAHEDAGNDEFQVPLEPAEIDWEITSAEQPSEPPARAEETLQGEEMRQHPDAILPDEDLTALPVPEHSEIAAEGQDEALEEPQPAVPEAQAEQPELELESEFELILEPEELAAPHEMLSQVPPAKMPEAAEHKEEATVEPTGKMFSSDQFLSDLAKEIDELGLDELTPTMSEPHQEQHEPVGPARESATTRTETGPLKEVFDEFRAELGEMGAEDEDLETHYNLGIAFREMGLLEEAIGEFQKVAKASDRGKAFRYAMQCSTLLGLAFMEKGQPDIAAIWYDRALSTPGLDSESKLALRYDLGVAQESAGDLEAALKSFSQVYAVNIDYRDVADRIASLQKPAR